MWYIKYFWVKFNIMVLTPLVWIQNKYNAYKDFKQYMYTMYLTTLDTKK